MGLNIICKQLSRVQFYLICWNDFFFSCSIMNFKPNELKEKRFQACFTPLKHFFYLKKNHCVSQSYEFCGISISQLNHYKTLKKHIDSVGNKRPLKRYIDTLDFRDDSNIQTNKTFRYFPQNWNDKTKLQHFKE